MSLPGTDLEGSPGPRQGPRSPSSRRTSFKRFENEKFLLQNMAMATTRLTISYDTSAQQCRFHAIPGLTNRTVNLVSGYLTHSLIFLLISVDCRFLRRHRCSSHHTSFFVNWISGELEGMDESWATRTSSGIGTRKRSR